MAICFLFGSPEMQEVCRVGCLVMDWYRCCLIIFVMRGVGPRMYRRSWPDHPLSLPEICEASSGDYLLYGRNHVRVRGFPCIHNLYNESWLALEVSDC